MAGVDEVDGGVGATPPLELELACDGELLGAEAVCVVGVLLGPVAVLAGGCAEVLAELAAGELDGALLEDEWLLEPPHPASAIVLRMTSAIRFIAPS